MIIYKRNVGVCFKKSINNIINIIIISMYKIKIILLNIYFILILIRFKSIYNII